MAPEFVDAEFVISICIPDKPGKGSNLSADREGIYAAHDTEIKQNRG
jgi:hypothetical protein